MFSIKKKFEWTKELEEEFAYMVNHAYTEKEIHAELNIPIYYMKPKRRELNLKKPKSGEKRNELMFCSYCKTYKEPSEFPLKSCGGVLYCKNCRRVIIRKYQLKKRERERSNPDANVTKEMVNQGPFRKCNVCKKIKSVNSFSWFVKFKSLYGACNECNKIKHRESELKRIRKVGW